MGGFGESEGRGDVQRLALCTFEERRGLDRRGRRRGGLSREARLHMAVDAERMVRWMHALRRVGRGREERLLVLCLVDVHCSVLRLQTKIGRERGAAFARLFGLCELCLAQERRCLLGVGVEQLSELVLWGEMSGWRGSQEAGSL